MLRVLLEVVFGSCYLPVGGKSSKCLAWLAHLAATLLDRAALALKRKRAEETWQAEVVSCFNLQSLSSCHPAQMSPPSHPRESAVEPPMQQPVSGQQPPSEDELKRWVPKHWMDHLHKIPHPAKRIAQAR